RLRPVERGLAGERLGHAIERLVPADALEPPGALRPDAAERIQEAVGMVHALGVAPDLLADHAPRVRIPVRAAHAPYPALVQSLDLERAGARAVVRTHGGDDVEVRPGRRHGPRIPDPSPPPPSSARPPCYRCLMATRAVALVLACAVALAACTRM